MKLSLSFRSEHPRYKAATWRALAAKACREVFKQTGLKGEVALSLLLSTDAHIQTMNHDFRGKNKPTNVLSFPADEPDYLGDVIISMDTLAREAKEQRKKLKAHFIHLTVHSCLHLLGHNHEEEGDAEAMEQKEIEILQSLGIKNPYSH